MLNPQGIWVIRKRSNRFHQETSVWFQIALPGFVPPVQFWLVRNSPEFFASPRPFLSKTSCISLISRNDRGRPSRTLSKPYCMAAT